MRGEECGGIWKECQYLKIKNLSYVLLKHELIKNPLQTVSDHYLLRKVFFISNSRCNTSEPFHAALPSTTAAAELYWIFPVFQMVIKPESSHWWPLHLTLANAEWSEEDTIKRKTHPTVFLVLESCTMVFFPFYIQENDARTVCNFINVKVKPQYWREKNWQVGTQWFHHSGTEEESGNCHQWQVACFCQRRLHIIIVR